MRQFIRVLFYFLFFVFFLLVVYDAELFIEDIGGRERSVPFTGRAERASTA